MRHLHTANVGNLAPTQPASKPIRAAVVGALFGASCLLIASGVRADASVQVRVTSASGGSVDGKVVLAQAGAAASAQKYSCQTQKGVCGIAAVPGGSYMVHFEPPKGESTKPRKVMIPPSGKVTLNVSAR